MQTHALQAVNSSCKIATPAAYFSFSDVVGSTGNIYYEKHPKVKE
jgi:hypothetical protein